MVNIAIDNFTDEITMAVKAYTDDVTEAIEKEVDQTSKEMMQEIRNTSPRKVGNYAKGWTRKKEGEGGKVKYTIYNKNKPYLTHLLENGHAKRGGGRVAARPHIRPAYDKYVPTMEDRIKAIIRNGG